MFALIWVWYGGVGSLKGIGGRLKTSLGAIMFANVRENNYPQK